MLIAGLVLGGSASLIGVPVARADPFSPAQVQYLNDVRPRLQTSGDPQSASLSDARLVGEGWWACHDQAIGAPSPQTSPVIVYWAVQDLCPHGCPQGCGHRG
jgi:hypothetical protein